MSPDVLIADGTAAAVALRQVTRTIPIVFLMASDPVGMGIVQSLARPGGNATGVFALEFSMGGKWLELLKEIVPDLRRVAVIFNLDTGPLAPLYLHSVETAATLFSIEVTGISVHETSDIERAISSVAQERGSGLIVLTDVFTISHRKQIIALAAQHRLPTIYAIRYFAADGGLLSYGPSILGMIRQVHRMSIGFSRVRNPRICRFRVRLNSSWCSISRPRRRSASPFPISSSQPPTFRRARD